MADAGAGQAGFQLVSVNDAFLDLIQQLTRPAHFLAVAHGDGEGVVDHHHGCGAHTDLGARHGDNRGRAGCNAGDLDRHVAGIFSEHGVDLRSGNGVAARRVDGNNDGAVCGEQLLPERGRGYLIPIPAFLRNRPLQKQRPLLRVGFVSGPIPEMLVHLDFLLPRLGGSFSSGLVSSSGASCPLSCPVSWLLS